MKKCPKQIITYIKENKEKTVIINKINASKIKKQILEQSTQKKHKIQENIELIDVKNITLEDIKAIETSPQTICILDNCFFIPSEDYLISFKGVTLSPHHKDTLSLLGGTFQLINPILKKDTTFYSIYNTDLEIDYNELSEDSPYKATIITDGVNNVKIQDNKKIKLLELDAERIHLSGKMELKYLHIIGNEIILGKDKEMTQITIQEYPSYHLIIEAEVLELNNCIIKNEQENGILRLEMEKITGKNFEIKSKSDIYIKDRHSYHYTIYNQKGKDDYITITEKDILTINLISILKGYKEIIETNIYKRTEQYITENQNKKLLQEIKIIEEKLQKQAQMIKMLKEQKETLKKELDIQNETRKEPIKKNLAQQPIRKILKK